MWVDEDQNTAPVPTPLSVKGRYPHTLAGRDIYNALKRTAYCIHHGVIRVSWPFGEMVAVPEERIRKGEIALVGGIESSRCDHHLHLFDKQPGFVPPLAAKTWLHSGKRFFTISESFSTFAFADFRCILVSLPINVYYFIIF